MYRRNVLQRQQLPEKCRQRRLSRIPDVGIVHRPFPVSIMIPVGILGISLRVTFSLIFDVFSSLVSAFRAQLASCRPARSTSPFFVRDLSWYDVDKEVKLIRLGDCLCNVCSG